MRIRIGSKHTFTGAAAMGAVLLAAFATPLPAYGGPLFTWQGDNNDNWVNAGNWSQDPGSGDIPGDPTDDVEFKDSADRFRVDLNNATRVVRQITVETTGQPYEFFDGTIECHGSLYVNTPNSTTTFEGFVQAADDFWGSGNPVVFNGPIGGSAEIGCSNGEFRLNAAGTSTGVFHIYPQAIVTLGHPLALQYAQVIIDVGYSLDLNGLDATLGSIGGQNGIFDLDAQTVTVSQVAPSSIRGVTGDPGAKLIKRGAEMFNISTYVGTVGFQIEEGTLRIGADGTIPNLVIENGTALFNSGAKVTFSPVYPQLNDQLFIIDRAYVTTGLMIAEPTGVLELSDAAAGPALTIGMNGPASPSSTFAGVIRDHASGPGSIRKVGFGQWTLTNANTFTGGIAVEDGTLRLADDSAAGSGTITLLGSTVSYAVDVDIANPLDVQSNGTLKVVEETATQSGGFVTSGNPFELIKSGVGTLVLNTPDIPSNGTMQIDNGILRLAAGDTLSNCTVAVNKDNGLDVNGFNAVLGGLTGSGALDIGAADVSVGANDFDTAYDGALGGSGELTKVGTGDLTLTGGGQVGTLTADTGDLIVSGGSLGLATEGNDTIIVRKGATGRIENGATVEATGTNGLRRVVVLGADSSLTISGAGSSYTGPRMDVGRFLPGTATVSVEDHALLTIGNLVLGDTASTNGVSGVMDVRTDASVNTVNTWFHRRSTLNIDGGMFATGQLVEASEQSHTINLSDPVGGGAALTVAPTSPLSVFNGLIQDAAGGPGSIRKLGTGSLTLGGSNTYSGSTTIDGGSLLAVNTNGSATGTSDVIVNATGVLGGTGSVSGNICVNANGTLAPGLSAGELTVGGVVFDGGSLGIEIGGTVAGTEYDQLVVHGDVTIQAGSTLNVSMIDDFIPTQGDVFVLLQTTAGTLSGTFDGLAEGDSVGVFDGVNVSITYQANDGNDIALVAGGSIPGDCDGDGDVDLTDYADFEACFTGPAGAVGSGCACFDFDDDGDNDLFDFAVMQTKFTGAP